jgi:DNA-binding transcriptional LysR family regulator
MTDLNRIAVFAQVVTAGSFSAGARALGIPKSSASRSVRHLEDALGVRLLERTTRRLRLTEAGREYYERVAAALSGLNEARAAVMDLQDTPKGTIRMAAPSAWGSWLLAPLVAQFVQTYPDIHIELSLTDGDVDLVRDGFDLALRMGRLEDSSLIVRTIGSVDRGLFASTTYLERRGTPERLADLAMHDVVAFRGDRDRGGNANANANGIGIGHGNGNGHGERLRLQGPDGLESITVRGRIETDAFSFVFESVRLGVGIGLLPLGGCVTHMRLVRVLPELIEPGYPVSVVYPSSRHLPQRVRLLRDALIALFSTRKPHFTETIPPETAHPVLAIPEAAGAPAGLHAGASVDAPTGVPVATH